MVGLYLGTDDPLDVAGVAGAGQLWAAEPAHRYCADVLQQLSAVGSAVESVSKVVVRNYLERCVTDSINGGDPLIYTDSATRPSG